MCGACPTKQLILSILLTRTQVFNSAFYLLGAFIHQSIHCLETKNMQIETRIRGGGGDELTGFSNFARSLSGAEIVLEEVLTTNKFSSLRNCGACCSLYNANKTFYK